MINKSDLAPSLFSQKEVRVLEQVRRACLFKTASAELVNTFKVLTKREQKSTLERTVDVYKIPKDVENISNQLLEWCQATLSSIKVNPTNRVDDDVIRPIP
jgi:hypothetical protein